MFEKFKLYMEEAAENFFSSNAFRYLLYVPSSYIHPFPIIERDDEKELSGDIDDTDS